MAPAEPFETINIRVRVQVMEHWQRPENRPMAQEIGAECSRVIQCYKMVTAEQRDQVFRHGRYLEVRNYSLSSTDGLEAIFAYVSRVMDDQSRTDEWLALL